MFAILQLARAFQTELSTSDEEKIWKRMNDKEKEKESK